MRIAYDAKRAYNNNTGLGQYSRNLLSALLADYPQHQYYLATPKVTGMFQPVGSHVRLLEPNGFYKAFPSLWRSNGVRHQLAKHGVELYHGLSHELPIGLGAAGIRSVVTMHDLIFERYPKQYKPVDVAIYRKKFRYACQHADVVIAISQQTKQDLIDYYRVPEQKIQVCYQSCNTAFQGQLTSDEKELVRAKYQLPNEYLLTVGSVIERKNLMTICKALHSLKGKLDMPLVVIGTGGDYMSRVKQYISSVGMQQQIVFLSERTGGVAGEDMPAIYQMANMMLYPSIFEGFGIPILEALWSKLPVVTSNVSCMPETGGDAAKYVNPLDMDELATAILDVATNSNLREQMIAKGLVHAQRFAPSKCAAHVMDVYKRLLS